MIIVDRLRGEVGIAARARGRFVPAVHFLVNRLDLGLIGRMRREIVEDLAAKAIARADADRVETVEHVELGQRDSGDARPSPALPNENRPEEQRGGKEGVSKVRN